MPSYLCLSIHFLDPAYHGRVDGGAPEWPPSPLRLFQGLVAASAARWGERHQLAYARPALRWLEQQPPPLIVAPPAVTGSAYRLSVPNNAMDIVGRAWNRGNTSGSGDASPATHRAMKTVRPTRLGNRDARPGEAAVYYLWELPEPLSDEIRGHAETLGAAARSLVALGWGVDLVAGHGQVVSAEDADQLPGERWRPSHSSTGNGLRVPTPGTLDALANRHEAFLHRLDGGMLTPVPALTAFAVVGYRRGTDPDTRPLAAFELWQPAAKLAELPPGKSKFRPFDPLRAVTVAAMVRHALDQVARQTKWGNEKRINTFIHGHTPDGEDRSRGDGADQRFAYLPLPTINPKKVESVRRVLVVGPPGAAAEVDWARRALSGRELLDEATRQPAALLALISANDPNLRRYVSTAAVWSTVTPVVLPGHDEADPPTVDRRVRRAPDEAARRRVREQAAARTEQLLRRAFEQAGMPPELVRDATLEWRHVGFRPGVDLATRYERPQPILLPRYHVRVRWPAPVRGPLFVGAARYRGLGIFAVETP